MIAGVVNLDGLTNSRLLTWLGRCISATVALPIHTFGAASFVVAPTGCLTESEGLLVAAMLRPLLVSSASDLATTFRRQGPEALSEQVGNFALAIWDGQTRQLWLGRDLMGNRPLFLRRLPGNLVFCSSLAPLLALPPVPEVDASFLCNHLLMVPGTATQTAWQGIERVPAGCILAVDHQGRSRTVARRVLKPTAVATRLDPSDWVEGFALRFDQALRRCLPPTGRVGAALSGGLDSSSVVAQALTGGACTDIHAYAARFPATPASDEGCWLTLLSPLPGLHLNDVDLSAASPLAQYRDRVTDLAEPILTQNLHLWTAVYRAASADGLGFLLDGHDGDSALDRGRRQEARLIKRPWWSHLRALMRRHRAAGPQQQSLALLNSDFAQTMQARERLRALEAERQIAQQAGAGALHHWRLERSGYPVYATERMSIVASSFGIELGHPFYDLDLLAWCLALPENIKMRDGYSRWVLRQAMTGRLPEPLRLRAEKASLAHQFHRACIELDGPEIDALLADQSQNLRQYVDLQKLRRLWVDYRQTGSGSGGSLLWPALTLAVFLESKATLTAPPTGGSL